MKPPKKKYQNFFRDDLDPEIRAIARQIERDRAAGKIKDPPASRKQIHSLEDLARFVFKKAQLDGSHQMLFENGALCRVAWSGYAYTDNVAEMVCDIAPNLPDKDVLRELRLVATKISKESIRQLQKTFPLTRITVISEAEEEADWRWTQAAFPEHPIVQD